MTDISLSVPSEIRWSPNHAGPRSRTRGVFIHSTRGGTLGTGGTKPTSGDAWINVLEREYQATLNFVDGPNANQVGPTWVVGPRKAARCIVDDSICWAQTVDNDDFLSIEVAQPAYQPSYSDFQYQACAEICARYAKKYNFPIVRIPRQTAKTVEVNGIIGHEDSYAGYSRGKTDPGYRWDWNKFIAMTVAKYDELFVPKTDPGYDLVSADFKAELLKRPELGVPRVKSVVDSLDTEYVLCKPVTGHRFGLVVVYRPYFKTIGRSPLAVADWGN